MNPAGPGSPYTSTDMVGGSTFLMERAEPVRRKRHGWCSRDAAFPYGTRGIGAEGKSLTEQETMEREERGV